MRLLQTLCSEIQSLLFSEVANRQIRNLALDIFRHLHQLPLSFHLERQTGGLAQAIDRGAKSVEFMLSAVLYNLVPTIIELIGVCVIFWLLFGHSYALIALVTIIFYAVLTARITSWRIAFRRRMNAADEATSTRAVDSLINHETVKYFNAEDREAASYDQALADYEHSAVVNQRTLSALNLAQAVLIAGGLAAVLVLAAADTSAGAMTPGELTMLNAYLLQIFLPLNFLGTVYRMMSQATIDMERLFGLLDQKSDLIDPPGAGALPAGPGAVEFDRVQLELGGRQVLSEVSFSIPAGGRFALVGETGAGKSTIVRLVARIIDPDAGAVAIDGTDVRSVLQQSVRAQIAVVPQDTVMFNASLEYNLRYGCPDATAGQLDAAVAAAGLDEFVGKLPQGLDTLVGERGLKLSGGERQRLAIARAALKQPRIYVLDEATSALDVPTEKRIKQALARVTAGCTTLVIAHRLATVADCDCIMFLADGRIVERGTHAELLAADGNYAAAWQMQVRAGREPAN
ncbi:MAG: ABC transporter ATP-binding protein/permease [Betaproteobacteria bacterium]|nr:ABC transporter ATP-binding protein/permease [Betaproteobacteria bacterium]